MKFKIIESGFYESFIQWTNLYGQILKIQIHPTFFVSSIIIPPLFLVCQK